MDDLTAALGELLANECDGTVADDRPTRTLTVGVVGDKTKDAIAARHCHTTVLPGAVYANAIQQQIARMFPADDGMAESALL